MKPLRNYINIKKRSDVIHATDDTIHRIVKDELDRLGHDADLNHIDVSEVTNMDRLFSYHTSDILDESYEDLNPDISKWNVSNVKDMYYMFFKCHKFNCDISSWDVRKVEDIRGIFCECKSFNQDLSNWDVSKVEDMAFMFYKCKKFNQDISQWDVSNVNYNYNMFEDCPIKEEFKPKFKV